MIFYNNFAKFSFFCYNRQYLGGSMEKLEQKWQRSVVSDLYKKYDFLFDEDNKTTFFNIMDQVIIKSKDKNGKVCNLQKNGEEYFRNYINTELTLYESEQILHKFIDTKFSLSDNKEDCIEQLYKLEYFLNEVQYELTEEMAFSLIEENEMLNELFSVIVDDPYETKKIEVSKNIKMLADTYCEKNHLINSFFSLKEQNSIYCKSGYPSYEALTETKEKELFKQYDKKDEKIKKELVSKNIKYVEYLSCMYLFYHVPYEDLVQEGIIGLLYAIDHFDVSLGYRFSTYATQYIRTKIERYIANNITILSTTQSYGLNLKKYYLKKDKLEKELGRTPTLWEFSQKYHLPLAQVKEYEQILNCCSENFFKEIVNEETLVEDKAIRNCMSLDMNRLFIESYLTNKEIKIIKGRYGFENNEMKTLQQLANEMGFSRTYVQHMEDSAMLKMRNQEFTQDLSIYMDDPKQCIKNLNNYWNQAYSKAYNNPNTAFAKTYRKLKSIKK